MDVVVLAQGALVVLPVHNHHVHGFSCLAGWLTELSLAREAMFKTVLILILILL